MEIASKENNYSPRRTNSSCALEKEASLSHFGGKGVIDMCSVMLDLHSSGSTEID
jgi:hypothetical protein